MTDGATPNQRFAEDVINKVGEGVSALGDITAF